MKKLIGNIQKFSTEDGPGVRSTVFIKGCPLKCRWCHNPEMINPEQQMIVSPRRCVGCMACIDVCPNHGITVTGDGPQIAWNKCDSCGHCVIECYAKAITPVGKEMSVDEIMEEIIRDREFYESTGGGVTISGGELLLHTDFAKALTDACAAENINVCLDTSGYGNYDDLYRLASSDNVQYVLFDIKHISDGEHIKYTGVSNKIILENLKRLSEDPLTKERIWIRLPLINGVNDDDRTLQAEFSLFNELGVNKVTLIGYHELGKSKAIHIGAEYETFEAPSEERMLEIKDELMSMGIQVEITGNGDAIM